MATADVNSTKAFVREWIDGNTTWSTNRSGNDDVGFAGLLYDSCLDLFKELYTESCRSSFLSKDEQQQLKEELGRLFLWGDAFGDGKLDRILVQSSDLRNTILEFISGIGKVLTGRFLTMTCKLRQEEKFSRQADDLHVLIEKAESIINESHTRDGDADEESDSDASDCSRPSVVEDIGSYTRCLMDLIPSMERTLGQVLYDKQNEQIPLAASFQVSGPARTYVQNIFEKFRRADPKLVERLGEANWQRHMTVRQRVEELASPSNDIEDKVPIITEAGQSIFKRYSMFHDSGLGASLPTQSAYAASAVSQTSFVSSHADSEKNSIRVPPTPCEVAAGEPFRCNICGNILKNIRHRVDWKLHVFADLEPYICTFSTCKDELVTFPTRKLWPDHEFSEHRVDRTWHCPECSEVLNDDGVWRKHLETSHKLVFSSSQLRIAAASAEKKTPCIIGNTECPLCLEIAGPTRRTFTTHVGKHMEEIALVVIPRETDSDSEAESESSNEDGFTGVDKTDEILGQNLTKAPMNGKDKSTSVDPWMDDYLLLDTHSDFRSQVPKLDRMMSDIYQDELFIPASASATSAPLQQTRQPPTTNSALLSPYQTVFSERLQAANNSHLTARSQSMASTISHQRSPFRKGSPYAASGERRDSSAHVRFQQEADAIALELQRSLNDMSTTKTIAPRDALLDYEEDEDMPLGLYNSLDSQQELEQPSRSSILPDTQSDIGDTVKIDYIARDNSNHFRR